MKIRLRACNRCGGDLVPDGSDRYGETLSCLQCGHEVVMSRRAGSADPLLRSISRASVAAAVESAVAIGGGKPW